MNLYLTVGNDIVNRVDLYGLSDKSTPRKVLDDIKDGLQDFMVDAPIGQRPPHLIQGSRTLVSSRTTNKLCYGCKKTGEIKKFSASEAPGDKWFYIGQDIECTYNYYGSHYSDEIGRLIGQATILYECVGSCPR